MKCQKCGKETFLPFRCPYCRDYFCPDHRLPENHECPRMELARAPKKETKQIVVQEPYEHTISYTPFKPNRKIRFSDKEIKHLAIATVLVVAIGLSSILYVSIELSHLALFTVILTASFFVHEIAHKIAAQRRGFWAEFRLIFTGAILTLISVISPFFKIISPGAVMISGSIDNKSIGKISIVGPLTNILLSTLFLMVALLSNQFAMVFMLGAAFNAWIALFNLIPFGMLDGFKILLWNRKVWALSFTASLILTAVSFYYYVL